MVPVWGGVEVDEGSLLALLLGGEERPVILVSACKEVMVALGRLSGAPPGPSAMLEPLLGDAALPLLLLLCSCGP